MTTKDTNDTHAKYEAPDDVTPPGQVVPRTAAQEDTQEGATNGDRVVPIKRSSASYPQPTTTTMTTTATSVAGVAKSTRSGAGSKSRNSYLKMKAMKGSFLLSLMQKLRIPLWLITVVAVGAPIIGMLYFASMYVISKQTSEKNNQWLETNIPLVYPLLDYNRNVQLERAYTAVYLCNFTNATKNAMLAQRTLTDQSFTAYVNYLTGVDQALQDAAQIPQCQTDMDLVRRLTNANTTTGTAAAQMYTTITERNVNVVAEMSRADAAGNDILDIWQYARLKDVYSQQMAAGVLTMDPTADPREPYSFLRVTDVLEAAFLSHLDPDVAALYNTAVRYSADNAASDNLVYKYSKNGLPMPNVTQWWAVSMGLQNGFKGVRDLMLTKAINSANDAGAAAVASADAGMSALIVVAVGSLLIALLQWYVTSTSNANQQMELEARRELEVAMERFVPADFFTLLDSDIHSLRAGHRRVVSRTVLVLHVWNYEGLTTSGDVETFTMSADVFGAVFETVGRHDGFVEKISGDHVTAIFETATTAVQTGLDLQVALEQRNVQRVRDGREPVEYGMAVHGGTVCVGVVGTEQRLEGVATSGTTAFLQRIGRLGKSLRARLVVTGPVLGDVSGGVVLQTRSLGYMTPAHRSDPGEVVEVYNLDPPELRALKAQSSALLTSLHHRNSTLEATRAAVGKALEMERSAREALAQEMFDRTLQLKADAVGSVENVRAVRVHAFSEK